MVVVCGLCLNGSDGDEVLRMWNGSISVQCMSLLFIPLSSTLQSRSGLPQSYLISNTAFSQHDEASVLTRGSSISIPYIAQRPAYPSITTPGS